MKRQLFGSKFSDINFTWNVTWKWLKSHTPVRFLTGLTLTGQLEMGLASKPRGCSVCHLRVESLTFAYYYFAGRLGAHIHGDFHDRDVLQHPSERIHSTQKQLHEESLEYHGLHCCRFRVSDYFDAIITVCKKTFSTIILKAVCCIKSIKYCYMGRFRTCVLQFSKIWEPRF